MPALLHLISWVPVEEPEAFQWLLQGQQHLGWEQTPDRAPHTEEGSFRTGYQLPTSHSLPQTGTGDKEICDHTAYMDLWNECVTSNQNPKSFFMHLEFHLPSLWCSCAPPPCLPSVAGPCVFLVPGHCSLWGLAW